MNKSWFLLLCALTFLIKLNAQKPVKNSEVPELVQKAFKEKFSSKKLNWLKKEDLFFGRFKQDRRVTDAVFDQNGNFIQTVTHLKRNTLPPIVLAGINSSQFSNWKFVSAEFVETYKNIAYYNVGLTDGKTTGGLKIDVLGNVVSN